MDTYYRAVIIIDGGFGGYAASDRPATSTMSERDGHFDDPATAAAHAEAYVSALGDGSTYTVERVSISITTVR